MKENNLLSEKIKGIGNDISKGLDDKMKEVLLKHGFDVDEMGSFEFMVRVEIVENYEDRSKKLLLDDKPILCFSDIKVNIQDDKISAYIEYYEPK